MFDHTVVIPSETKNLQLQNVFCSPTDFILIFYTGVVEIFINDRDFLFKTTV